MSLNNRTQEQTVELWLVRHGESVANSQGKISGWHDVELSPRGRAMAEALRPLLAPETFDSFVASDLIRAQETARLAYGEPAVDRRIKELDFGDLEGKRWDDLTESTRNEILAFSEDCAPGGESISVFERRIFDYLEGLTPGRHLLFVHGGVIRLVLRQMGYDRFVPPTSVAVVDWTHRALLELKLGPTS